MKFYKPKFWDKRGSLSLFSILLLPLSLIAIIKNYYEDSKIKKNFYDLKTICVGNIYIGGTGKTPLVYNLATHFKVAYFILSIGFVLSLFGSVLSYITFKFIRSIKLSFPWTYKTLFKLDFEKKLLFCFILKISFDLS